MMASLLLAVALSRIHECIDELDPLDERQQTPTWSGHANAQCEVKVETLAANKGATLLAGWYRWPMSDLPKYSVVTFVAYEQPTGSDVVRQLFTRVESEDIMRFEGVWMKAGILEILGCLNGTGGCGQQFFAWRTNELVPVATNYRDAFNRKLPRGLTTYKSPNLDLKTMTISGGGWRDGKDANCCPSVIMNCKVSFVRDQAQLSGCRPTRP